MKYYLICIFLFAGFTTELFAVYRFDAADSLFRARSYQTAAIEYERAAFTSLNNIEHTEALLKKSECLKLLKDFDGAVSVLGRLNFAGLSDTLIYEARYQTGLCAYLGDNFNEAESQLAQAHYFIKDTSIIAPSFFLYALILNEQGKWTDAKQKALASVRTNQFSASEKDSLIRIINELYLPENYPKLKKLSKAQNMSMFIPGLGQMYVGYPKEGMISASLVLVSLAYMAFNIYTHHYIAALTVSSAIFQRFYTGGMNRLEFLVAKKNHDLMRKYNDFLRAEILKIENRK